MTESHFILEARTARAFSLPQGAYMHIINTFGSQVVDTWAFCADDVTEHMSMEHTRVHADHPTPQIGTLFRTSKRRPILEFVSDTSSGQHDWFYAACDQQRYELLGAHGAHANCTDNLIQAMTDIGNPIRHVPCPLNLFENAPLLNDGDMAIKPPTSQPGDNVTLKAKMNIIVCLSACPQDLAPTNGADMTPKDVEIRLEADIRRNAEIW